MPVALVVESTDGEGEDCVLVVPVVPVGAVPVGDAIAKEELVGCAPARSTLLPQHNLLLLLQQCHSSLGPIDGDLGRTRTTLLRQHDLEGSFEDSLALQEGQANSSLLS